jgi:hypothetical protein
VFQPHVGESLEHFRPVRLNCRPPVDDITTVTAALVSSAGERCR